MCQLLEWAQCFLTGVTAPPTPPGAPRHAAAGRPRGARGSEGRRSGRLLLPLPPPPLAGLHVAQQWPLSQMRLRAACGTHVTCLHVASTPSYLRHPGAARRIRQVFRPPRKHCTASLMPHARSLLAPLYAFGAGATPRRGAAHLAGLPPAPPAGGAHRPRAVAEGKIEGTERADGGGSPRLLRPLAAPTAHVR